MTKKKTKPISAPDAESLDIIVKVHRYPSGTLFLRETIGDGKLGDQDVEFSLNASGQPMVRIGQGHWYLFNIQSMIEAVGELEKLPDAA